jgi:diadenosine tetraphosphate (Ap4A) HIT family hydrolase
MQGCLFCDVQRDHRELVGSAVYEDDLVYAYHWEDEGTSYLGQLALITKRHAPDFTDLTSAEAQAIGLLISRLSSALKTCTGAEKVYEFFYGEVTPHLHVLLMARYPGTPEDYWRWNIEDWPGAPRGDAEAIEALCQRLRVALMDGATNQ